VLKQWSGMIRPSVYQHSAVPDAASVGYVLTTLSESREACYSSIAELVIKSCFKGQC